MVETKEKNYKNFFACTEHDWKDVAPVAQYEGGETILQIKYQTEYKTMMDLFRAIVKSNEISERVFELTEYVVRNACGNYTAWFIRRKCLETLKKDYREEIQFVNELMPRNEKVYQIWEQRRYLVDKLGDPSGEMNFLNEKILSNDNKNYHAWSYRKWLVTKFNLFESEVAETDAFIEEDIRNNSAWNHRYFIFSQYIIKNKEDLEKEIKFAFSNIKLVASNESAWSYLNGWFPFYNFRCFRPENKETQTEHKLNKLAFNYNDFPEIEKFCEQINALEEESFQIYSLSTLINIYLLKGEKEGIKKAIEFSEKLAIKLDPIRKNYWLWTQKNIKEEFSSVLEEKSD